jgi:predicted amidophosphoribosyltransferase
MEVKNCRGCGRLYNYVGGGNYRNLCPDCISKLEDKFQEVKRYIEDNRVANIKQIAEDCDVNPKQIEQWVREERLVFSDDSPIAIFCQSCGAPIKSGKYCSNCKETVSDQLSQLYGTKPIEQKTKRTATAKMRFLDK